MKNNPTKRARKQVNLEDLNDYNDINQKWLQKICRSASLGNNFR